MPCSYLPNFIGFILLVSLLVYQLIFRTPDIVKNQDCCFRGTPVNRSNGTWSCEYTRNGHTDYSNTRSPAANNVQINRYLIFPFLAFMTVVPHYIYYKECDYRFIFTIIYGFAAIGGTVYFGILSNPRQYSCANPNRPPIALVNEYMPFDYTLMICQIIMSFVGCICVALYIRYPNRFGSMSEYEIYNL